MPDKPIALVTGGSRGIGRSTAIQLADDGFDVAFCYRRDVDAAGEVAAELGRRGAKVFHATCDVADFDAATDFVQQAQSALGKVDALVNSAGIVKDNPMVLMNAADWHAVIDTNLTGTFNFCKALSFDFMKRRSGVIVNVSSVAGIHGNPGQTNYSAAKAGINGMSRALSKEFGRYGIRVNVVAPGFIETDMTDALPEKVRTAALNMIGLRRFGTAQDVADLVSFLVSDKAGYLTGQVLQVDGGIVL